MIGLVWYFNAVLKLGSIFGVFYSLLILVSLCWGLYAGTLIDRYKRKHIFLAINVFGAISLAIAAFFAYQTKHVSMYTGLAVFTCTTLIYNIYYPNLYALAQEISEPGKYMRILSWIEIQGQAAIVVSGALAAVLLSGYNGSNSALLQHFGITFHIASWKLADVFLLDSITYLISFVLLLFMNYTPISRNHTDVESVWHRFTFGIRYLFSNRDLLWMGIGAAAVFNTIIMCSYYQMPIYISKYLQQASYVFAGAEMCFAFGALCAGILVSSVFVSKNNTLKIILLLGVGSMVYFTHVFNKNVTLFLLLNVVIGCCNAGIRIYRNIYFFRIVPNHVMGRVNSVTNTTSYLTRFIMGLLFSLPFFNTSVGIRWVMLLLGIYILLFVYMLSRRYNSLNQLEQTHYA